MYLCGARPVSPAPLGAAQTTHRVVWRRGALVDPQSRRPSSLPPAAQEPALPLRHHTRPGVALPGLSDSRGSSARTKARLRRSGLALTRAFLRVAAEPKADGQGLRIESKGLVEGTSGFSHRLPGRCELVTRQGGLCPACCHSR